MTDNDRIAWAAKNLQLNTYKKLHRGMLVKDDEGNLGVIVKIIEPTNSTDPLTDHGFVYVWHQELTGYGDDNCEHYAFSSWHEHLRIIENADGSEPYP